MTFEELLCEVRNIKCQEMRAETDAYFEAVVAKTEFGAVASVLQSYFGLPFKPAGARPSREADEFSAPYGGIQSNQIMYVRENGASAELALIWPWGSGAAATVKIIRK